MTLANPTSVASTRSLRLGALAVVANALLAAGSLSVLITVVDPGTMIQAAVALDALKFAVVGAIAAAAIRAGIRGLRESADGGRRGRAITGISVAGLFVVLTAGSLIATTVISLAS
jgi:hypothetical protein